MVPGVYQSERVACRRRTEELRERLASGATCTARWRRADGQPQGGVERGPGARGCRMQRRAAPGRPRGRLSPLLAPRAQRRKVEPAPDHARRRVAARHSGVGRARQVARSVWRARPRALASAEQPGCDGPGGRARDRQRKASNETTRSGGLGVGHGMRGLAGIRSMRQRASKARWSPGRTARASSSTGSRASRGREWRLRPHGRRTALNRLEHERRARVPLLGGVERWNTT